MISTSESMTQCMRKRYNFQNGSKLHTIQRKLPLSETTEDTTGRALSKAANGCRCMSLRDGDILSTGRSPFELATWATSGHF